ncbi:unnamed protein product [Trichobilharzia regenti]|nr:unnamed protein product [Trichobilharzia regenti]
MQMKSNKLAKEEASTEDSTSGEHRSNRDDEDSWPTPTATATTTDNNQHKWEEPESNNLLYLPKKYRFNYRRK